MNVVISRTTFRRILIVMLTLLVCGGVGSELSHYVFYRDDPFDLVSFFGLSYEKNLPTWVSSCLLFSCAVLLALIALEKHQTRAPYRAHWWGLALAFFYISLDEFVQLHEEASLWFDLHGVLHFGWVIPGTIVVTLMGIAYLGFLRHLPALVRNRFILAGAIYVGGALVVEFGLGYWTDAQGYDNFTYGMIDLLEESMEMIGSSLFLYSLLDCLAGPCGTLQIRLRP